MSIKQCSIFFAVATTIAVLLRTFMLFYTTNTETGFVKDEYSLFATIMLVLIVATPVLIYTSFMFTKKDAVTTAPNSIFYKAISIILAAVILYDTFFSTLDYSARSSLKVLEFVAAAVSAAYLIAFAVGDYFNVSLSPAFSLTVVAFWLARLLIIFSSFSALSNIADNMFELAAVCLVLVSSLMVSKHLTLPRTQRQNTITLSLLLATVCFCFSTCLPRLIVTLSGKASLLHINRLPILTPLVAGIYFLIFAIECFGKKTQESK